MSDYGDFLRKWAPQSMGGWSAAAMQDLFEQFYDNSHGSQRYYLRNTPWGFVRYLEDKAKAAQDRFDNTGVDEAYAGRIDSSLYGAGMGIAAGLSRGALRMARSLADVYVAEVTEDVGYNTNNPMFG